MDDKFYKLSQELTKRKDLGSTDKILYSLILDHVGENGKCWTGIRTLAGEIGRSCQCVLDAIGRLEKAGLVVVERGASGESNYYRIPQVKSAQESRTVPEKKRSRKLTTGAQESRAQALKKLEPNQTDQLNQTNICANAQAQFSQFWTAYPRKVNRKRALQLWTKIAPANGLFEKIMAALEQQKLSPAWTKDGGQFIPHPTTWLNGERWADEIEIADDQPRTKSLDEQVEETQRMLYGQDRRK